MASIERPAYPRLKQSLKKTELRDFYTPTFEEIEFVRQTARKEDTQLRKFRKNRGLHQSIQNRFFLTKPGSTIP
jgi:hypothetical protein